MVGRGAKPAATYTYSANHAEIDALKSIIAASLCMAERLRSEAASALLRRALASLRDRGSDDDAAAGTLNPP